MWQTILRFFDLHPWFLTSVAAIVILLTAAYKISVWLGHMIAAAWRARQDRRVLGYLYKRVQEGTRGPDAYGQVVAFYKPSTTVDIANALGIKPFKTRAILERLKEQRRVKQIGTHDMWCISEYEAFSRGKPPAE
jgi:hypothetical protein